MLVNQTAFLKFFIIFIFIFKETCLRLVKETALTSISGIEYTRRC